MLPRRPSAYEFNLLMTKILIIDNSVDTTGAFNSLIMAISKLDPKEFQFVYIFPEQSKYIERLSAQGHKVYGLPFIEISRRKKDLLLYFPRLYSNARKIRKLVKKEGIDFIHVNDIYNMVGVLVKKLYGIPLITHVRRMPDSFPAVIYNSWSKMHIRYADKIVVSTEANKAAIPPNDKTVVMYDSVLEHEDLPRYQPKEFLNREVTILYLANYNDGKGHLHALKMLKKALDELKDWKFQLDFYGGDFGWQKNADYKQGLIEFARENNLIGSVHFNDKTTEIEKVYKSYDVVLNLSDSESFSRVTLDALFFGVPIVATDVGGTREMVLHEKTGLIAPPKDVDTIFTMFKKMILDDNLRRTLSRNSYEFSRKEFSTERVVNTIRDVYTTVRESQK